VAEDRFQGLKDLPLSEVGTRQADLVAQRLADRPGPPVLPLPANPPLAIWYSRLARAAETARRIAQRQPGVPLLPSEALVEIGQGEWEGRLNEEVAREDGERLAAWRRDPTSAYAPGGEPLAVAADRVRRGLADMLETLTTSDAGERWAILVGHGGTLRLVLLILLELPYQRYWSFDFPPCAITVVQIASGRATLVAHNLADHLAPVARETVRATHEDGERTGAL
jgi:broad specificity phosphatase PhoE